MVGRRTLLLILCMLCALPRSAAADSAVLIPGKDNTLISSALPNSNALGDLYSGRTGTFGGSSIRIRAVLLFEVAAQIPAGSTITAAELSLTLTGASINGATSQTHTLHRVLADWGEGTSNGSGGQGAPATPDDATWQHTHYPAATWSAPGGDFAASVSSSATIGDTPGAVFTFPVTSQLVADVQEMLDNPPANFGWMIRGNEGSLFSARKFASRETPDAEPRLMVTFDPPPACVTDLNGDDGVDAADLALLLGSWGPCPDCTADLNDDGVIDAADLALLLGSWGPCG